MKETEVYAPNYEHGEEVVLIRFPHGGLFEIPRLRVNKHVPSAEALIGKNAKDAVVINSKVAETLSGADFDGDTVLVIPTKNNNIVTMINMSNIPCPKPISNVAPPIIDGKENINPKNETRPEATATIDNAIILPITNSLFLIGVIRTEASVPLSFSPAIAFSRLSPQPE